MRSLVRLGFIAWLLAEAGYIVNWLGVFLILVSASGMSFSSFLITCMATGAGVPLSWICWYKVCVPSSHLLFPLP